jgi:integral membrane protein (TIGR01906 family)
MKTLSKILLPILYPFVLLTTWMLILLSPLFIQVEYRRPGFPADPFGFSVAERIHWADVSRLYLLSNQPPDYFNQFTLGDGSPLYNAREIQHMADVQNLVSKAILLWALGGTIFLAACGFLLWKDRSGLRKSLSAAAGLALLILAAATMTVVLAWDTVFVGFHHLFFTGTTWQFLYSDSLIRLFPVEFWQDAVGVAMAGIFLTTLILWLVAGPVAGRLGRNRKTAKPSA